MDRRTALRIIGIGAAAVATRGAVGWLDGAFPLGVTGRLVTHTRLGMGTYVTLSAVDPSQSRAEDAMAAAWAELDRLEPLLSRFRPDSALSVLNARGSLDAPPNDLVRVLAQADQAHRATQGAFDPTVLPVLSKVEKECAAGRVPRNADLDGLMPLVGFGMVKRSERRIAFERNGMAMTLDGVAKGYIVDAMADAMQRLGVRHGLVNAGGDMRGFGGKAEGRPWTVAVQDPVRKGGTLQRLELFDGAIATSGDYEVVFDEARVFHHILDPSSCRSPHLTHSATVEARTAAEADSLATALLVLGPSGARLVELHARRVLLA